MSLLRYKVWEKKIETGKLTKSFKLCSLPPTNSALEQYILRARLTCKASLMSDTPTLDPTCYGWSKVNRNKFLYPNMLPISVKVAPEEILMENWLQMFIKALQ